MIVPFDQLPSSSRLWIYPSNRSFTTDEIPKLYTALTGFLDQWTAHNRTLETAFEIRYNRFIVIGVNQEKEQASGCSIDASVHFIQQLEKHFNVVLLDKMNVDYWSGEEIHHISLNDFKAMAKAKNVSKNTMVFNHLVATKEEYNNAWELEAHASWHQRFFQ